MESPGWQNESMLSATQSVSFRGTMYFVASASKLTPSSSPFGSCSPLADSLVAYGWVIR
jgi:hypothetical protein